MTTPWSFDDALRWAHEYVETMIAHGEYSQDRARFMLGLVQWWTIAQQVEHGARQQTFLQDGLRHAMWEQVEVELQALGITFGGTR